MPEQTPSVTQRIWCVQCYRPFLATPNGFRWYCGGCMVQPCETSTQWGRRYVR